MPVYFRSILKSFVFLSVNGLVVTVFSLIGLFAPTLTQAQVVNGIQEKLVEKYEEGKIEWVLGRAEKLMDNDKLKKTPEPFLWASMCYFELSHSDDPKIQAFYKNALKNALKYAAKAVSKDKDGNFMRENWDFVEVLKKESLEVAKTQLAEDNYRKANYTFKQLVKIDPSDNNILFLRGITDLKLNNSYEAERNISVAMQGLNTKYRDLDYIPDPVSTPLVKDEMVYYLDQLINTDLLDSARKVVFSARLFFPLDDEVNSRYEELVK